jgi:hypothetical protein
VRAAAEHRETSPRSEACGSLLMSRRVCVRLAGILAVAVAATAAAAAAAHAIRSAAAIVSAGPDPSRCQAFQCRLCHFHGLQQAVAGPRG